MEEKEKKKEGTYVDNVPHQESENNLKAQAKKGDFWKEALVFLKAKDYIQKLKEKKTQSGAFSECIFDIPDTTLSVRGLSLRVL